MEYEEQTRSFTSSKTYSSTSMNSNNLKASDSVESETEEKKLGSEGTLTKSI